MLSQPIFKNLILPLLLAVSTLAVYANSFNGPFIFDDSRIYSNPHIRISELTVENLLQAGLKSKPLSRPVANVSFALNYYFNKYQVKGYHVVNLLIHISTGILFYFLASFFLDLAVVKKIYGEAHLLSFIAALIWLVHPIQTQPVLYVVQRMTELAGMFYLAAFLCYVRGRQMKGLGGGRLILLALSFFFGLLAVGSKENAASLPFFLIIYEFYFGKNLFGNIRSIRFISSAIAVFLLVAAIIYLYLGPHPLQAVLNYSARDFTPAQRLMTEFRVVVFYLSLLFLPHPARLNLNHHFSLSLSPVDPVTTLLSMIVIIFLVVMAVIMARKQRLISFAILWFLGNLLIESSIIPLELVFEHRLYLPSMMAILAIVLICRGLIADKKTFLLFFLGVAALFAVWTFHRIQVWQDDLTFWSDCYAKSPQSVRSANSLAVTYEKKGNYIKAEKIYREALILESRSFIVLTNLGGLFLKENKMQEAESVLVRALELEKDFPQALVKMAIIRQKQKRFGEAEIFYLRLLQKEPTLPETQKIYDTLGRFREDKGDLKKALDFYRASLRADPDFAMAHNDIGILFAKKGAKEKALHHFQRAVEIDKNYLDARKNLQRALRLQRE